MKIAIFSDPHLGYARFEEDSYVQAENAIVSASEKADLILCAGDIFDIKIPKLETLKRAVEIFKKASIPVIAIHGNHERRSKEMTNPAQLLSASTGIVLIHANDEIFEKNGERIQVFGMGSVPEEYAQEALRQSLSRFSADGSAFKILMLHQSIKELIPNAKEEISLEYLETLPFDLIVNGHIHEKISKLGGKFIIPGSTVITQLKKEQMEKRGYYLFDTKTKQNDFIEIKSREFFYEELHFKEGEPGQIRDSVREKVLAIRKEHPGSIVAIKLFGSLKPGIAGADIKLEKFDERIFIDNNLDSENLAAKLEKIRNLRAENMTVKDLALKELDKKTSGKITMFKSTEIFESLVEGVDETITYLENTNKKSNK
ncbi:DNA repair exonuclease [Candidatus Micrarchaeota archaeon]|nr:DNA repair exonuclease [Candidatus Micrarchaeota archaeon]